MFIILAAEIPKKENLHLKSFRPKNAICRSVFKSQPDLMKFPSPITGVVDCQRIEIESTPIFDRCVFCWQPLG